ncbi:MAG: TetR/AcrR family transcriptional regulator [Candidatus Cyclobacteriaceae bacterium M2_1C_046]
MIGTLPNVNITVNEKIYLKNPDSSELGRRIIAKGVDMIDEMGMENFTFRKLAKEINSTEASIYRYFESKHRLLLYLTSWYWGWMEYQLLFTWANVKTPQEKLKKAILLLTQEVKEDGNFSHINEVKLHRIVISESSKAYLTKEVDQENKVGAFAGYKQLVGRISDVILQINPAYKYPHMLISTMIEGSHHQRFFAAHLPRLTDVIEGEDSITEFYNEMIFKAINTSTEAK